MTEELTRTREKEKWKGHKKDENEGGNNLQKSREIEAECLTTEQDFKDELKKWLRWFNGIQEDRKVPELNFSKCCIDKNYICRLTEFSMQGFFGLGLGFVEPSSPSKVSTSEEIIIFPSVTYLAGLWSGGTGRYLPSWAD